MKRWGRLKKSALLAIPLIALLVLLAYFSKDWLNRQLFEPTKTSLEQGIDSGSERPVEIVATNLQIPWGIDFLPEGDLLVTERPGTLKRIGKNQQIYPIQGVRHVGEGGLLGITLHPDFKKNNFVYLYLTTESNDSLINRVERYELKNDRLTSRRTIDNIPGARLHDGGQLAFGPDKMLYITTGDAGNEASAQDTNSLSGKILRLDEDGRVPAANPFDNPVYSFGHRNVQGITWDDQGRLWATEHGPSGTRSGNDELNLIEKGKNYGWPEIVGKQTADGMVVPVIESGADETWAPGGIEFVGGSLFFAGLRGETLYQARVISATELRLKGHFRELYGRLRAVTLGLDDFLYVTTSNTDGRGTENPSDDKILRIDPRIFE